MELVVSQVWEWALKKISATNIHTKNPQIATTQLVMTITPAWLNFQMDFLKIHSPEDRQDNQVQVVF